MDATIGTKDLRGTELDQGSFWDESGPRAKYMVVSDACWLYQDLELEQNLRNLDWRKARKRVLGNGHVKRRGWDKVGAICASDVRAWNCASPTVRVSWAGRSSKISSGRGGRDPSCEGCALL
jgi:hypothetical protein